MIDSSSEVLHSMTDAVAYQQHQDYSFAESRRVLEDIVSGKNLQDVLKRIVELAEKLVPGSLCSILLVDREEERLRLGAAPNLPEAYNTEIDGIRYGVGVGSCGTVAATGEAIVVENIDTHPYWTNFLEATTAANLHACWSIPVKSENGEVLATMAMYYSVPKKPTERELDRLVVCAQLVAFLLLRQKRELELNAARIAAEEANRAKSEFLSSMSHELRTPLNAILGFSQLMELDKNLPADHKEAVHEMLKAGNHLLQLINEILDLSKIEAGRVELSIEPVEVAPLVDECLTLTRSLADKRGISVNHACPSGAMVRADRTRLKQIILNLMSNAIKYNRDDGQVRISLLPSADSMYRIEVTDTGPGISPERMKELFQPFSRLGAEASNIEGTGIGLTITRRLVEIMGGSVNVVSKVGEGSTFGIELPQATLHQPVELEDRQPGRTDPQKQAGAVAHRTVLYIEDNPSNLRLVAQIMKLRNHIRLVTAHTPELGVAHAQTQHPDLVLLYINMPGMDGYQVLQILKAAPLLHAVPVIAVSANAMARDIERGMAAGFSDYLTKPIDVNRFLDAIDRYLASSEEGTMTL